MAQVNNTFDTYDSGRNRETLSDLIAMITPEETPFKSLIGEQDIMGTHPEWNQDALATPSTTNKRVEGDTYNPQSIVPTARVGDYAQISMKEFIVSETQEVVSKAGPKSDFNREKLKKGVELRTDMEVTLLSNQASLAGSAATPRQLGGFRAWIATNDSLGSAGASGGFNTSTGIVDAATNGTQRAFTKTLLDDNIEATYKTGGNPTTLMLSPYLKRVFSTFMSDTNVAAFRTQMNGKKQGTIYGAADEYVSDFGTIDVVPNRQMARVGATLARNAFLITPDKVTTGILRPIQEDKDVAKTSDAKPGVLKVEYSLLVKHEAAHGCIADLYGMTASS